MDGYARVAKADGRCPGRSGSCGSGCSPTWSCARGTPAGTPVTAHVTVLAPLGALRAAAAGHDACAVAHHAAAIPAPIPAVPVRAGWPRSTGSRSPPRSCRELLEQLDALCPGGLQAPTGGTLSIALTDPVTGALRATVTRGELERLARRGCPEHPAGDCGCPLLDRPAPVDRYGPSPAQRRFVQHPGPHLPAARLRATGPAGPTSTTSSRTPRAGRPPATNLCCLCRRHHRLKTHAPGWRFTMTADGTLTVTTPSGITRTTRPPGMRDHSEQPAPPLEAPDPPPF